MIVGGASNNGGVVLNWFKENFYAEENIEKLLADAQSIDPTAGGLIFLPWLLGERAPIWDSRATGVFLGMRDTHNRAHFSRAVLEGLVLNLYRIYQNVKRNNESGVEQIISGGGLARSPLWNQLLADVFNLPVQTMQETESSALGAILMAQKATGQIVDYQEVIHWQAIKNNFQPNEGNNEQYKRFSAVVFQLYEQLKTTFRAIDQL
jgi:gluconokinase